MPGHRIIRRLGQGGQGQVWLAVRAKTNEHVAIKIISREQLQSSYARERFEQGYRTLSLLNHPNIVKGLEYGLLGGGEVWHTLEYVRGCSLTEYVDRLDAAELDRKGARGKVRFPLRPVLELFVKVCQAVEAAHRVGVIHRDLKPSNILVDGEGEPRLVDFGLARLQEGSGGALVTVTGQFVGTPAWASPEQVEGRPEMVDVRSDVYALGVVLYQVLTGAFPYDVDGGLARTFNEVLHTEPTPPRNHARFITPDLQAVMLKALAKERERRYQSVTEFREDIERFLRGEAVLAKGDNLAYLGWKFVARHRAVAVATAVVVALTAVHAVTTTLAYYRTRRAEARAEAAANEATRRFELARGTAEFMLDEVDEKLKDVAGAGALRRSLLKKSYDRFEKLLAQYPDDPMAQRDLARWLKKLSDIALELGRLDESEAKRRAALQIHERLAAADPDNAELQEALSINLVLIGDIANERGDRETARRYYEQALKIDEQLVERHPENARFADNLGYSYERVACLFSKRQEDESARLDLLLRHLHLAERLVSAEPENLVRRYGLTMSNRLLAEHYMDWRGDEALAWSYLQVELELANRLVQADPTNAQFRFIWAIALGQRADYEWCQGNVEAAGEFDGQERVELERLWAAEPHRVQFMETLVGVRKNQGLAAAFCGDWSSAADHFGGMLAVQNELLRNTGLPPKTYTALFDQGARLMVAILAASALPGGEEAVMERLEQPCSLSRPDRFLKLLDQQRPLLQAAFVSPPVSPPQIPAPIAAELLAVAEDCLTSIPVEERPSSWWTARRAELAGLGTLYGIPSPGPVPGGP